MISISPFKALRPEPQFAKQVASRPYDVLAILILFSTSPAAKLTSRQELMFTVSKCMKRQKKIWMHLSAVPYFLAKASPAITFTSLPWMAKRKRVWFAAVL
jgi:uncharacterized protein (DUF1015 family)